MASYTPTGPWNPGGSPGISAPFLNNLETWIDQLDDTNDVQVTGQTSGTATLHQFLRGKVKEFIISFVSYKNTATQTLALPTAFTVGASIRVNETRSMRVAFLSGGSGGSAQTVHVNTAIALGGGTQSSQAYITSWSTGETNNGFDTIQLDTSATQSFSGFVHVIGE